MASGSSLARSCSVSRTAEAAWAGSVAPSCRPVDRLSVDEQVERVRAVTVDDVHGVLRQVLGGRARWPSSARSTNPSFALIRRVDGRHARLCACRCASESSGPAVAWAARCAQPLARRSRSRTGRRCRSQPFDRPRQVPVSIVDAARRGPEASPNRVDVVVDFTHVAAARENMLWLAENGIHAVVGTTGFNDAGSRIGSEAAFTNEQLRHRARTSPSARC